MDHESLPQGGSNNFALQRALRLFKAYEGEFKHLLTLEVFERTRGWGPRPTGKASILYLGVAKVDFFRDGVRFDTWYIIDAVKWKVGSAEKGRLWTFPDSFDPSMLVSHVPGLETAPVTEREFELPLAV